MTRLHRFWVRNTRCRNTTHERDWDHHPDRCKHCEQPMPLDPTRPYVGLLNPSIGD